MVLFRFRWAVLVCSLWSGAESFAPATQCSTRGLSPMDRAAGHPQKSAAGWTSLLRMTAPEEVAESQPPSAGSKSFDYALLFDCDGVILETEELHRRAYNKVFSEFGVTKVCGSVREPVEWSVGYYDILQNSIGGGKPKMRQYFSQALRFESNEHGDPTVLEVAKPFLEEEPKARPATPSDSREGESKKKKGRKTRSERERGASKPSPLEADATEADHTTIDAAGVSTTLELLIDALQDRKTELYKQTVAESATARPGLLDLMDAALADPTIGVGVCSASTKEAAQKVLECTLGPERVEGLDVCILGDDVSEKKPSPMIYNVAREKLGVASPSNCVVVEDSMVGLRAAKAASMRCLVTYTESTASEDFYAVGADAKVPDLANNGNPVTLAAIFAPLQSAGDGSEALPELLVGLKDELPLGEDESEDGAGGEDVSVDDRFVVFEDNVATAVAPEPILLVQETPTIEAEVEAETEVEAEIEDEVAAEAEVDAEIEGAVAADADVEAEVGKAEVETEIEDEIAAEAEVEAEVEIAADAEVEAEIEDEIAAEAEVEAEVETEIAAEAEPETEAPVAAISEDANEAEDLSTPHPEPSVPDAETAAPPPPLGDTSAVAGNTERAVVRKANWSRDDMGNFSL